MNESSVAVLKIEMNPDMPVTVVRIIDKAAARSCPFRASKIGTTAPELPAADVGIAMGAATDIAMENRRKRFG